MKFLSVILSKKAYIIKITALFLVLAISFFNILFISPAKAITSSGFSTSCQNAQDNESLNDLFALLSQLEEYIDQLSKLLTQQAIQDTEAKITKVQNSISVIKTDDPCIKNILSYVNTNITGSYNTIQANRAAAQKSFGEIQNTAATVNSQINQTIQLLENVKATIDQLTALRNLLLNLATFPLLAAVVGPIAAAITAVLETVGPQIITALNTAINNLLVVSANLQIAAGEIGAYRNLIGNLDESQISQLLDRTSSLTTRNQSLYNSIDNRLGVVQDGLVNGILPKLQTNSEIIRENTTEDPEVYRGYLMSSSDKTEQVKTSVLQTGTNISNIMNGFNSNLQNQINQVKTGITMPNVISNIGDLKNNISADVMIGVKSQLSEQYTRTRLSVEQLKLYIQNSGVNTSDFQSRLDQLDSTLYQMQGQINTLLGLLDTPNEPNSIISEYINISERLDKNISGIIEVYSSLLGEL